MAEITDYGYPSSFVPPVEKNSRKYILDYAKTLWRDAQQSRTTFSFESRKSRYIQNRKYSEGLQSIEKFKQQFSTTGDSTYLNLDWGVSTPLPKMAEVIRGQMINQPYVPQFIPVDSTSITEFDREKQVLKAKMKLRDNLGSLKEVGVPVDYKDAPENVEELEIYMETNFKLAQSIAMETVTRAILQDNNVDKLNEKIAKDLVDNKIAGLRILLDENKNIRIRYVDPLNLVTSFVTEDDFSDARHIGELIFVTVEDLRVQAQGQLSEAELYEVAKSVAGRYDNPSWSYGSHVYYNNEVDSTKYDKFRVRVLDFEFFSTDEVVFQKMEAKNGGFYFQEKPVNFVPPANPKRKREIIRKKIKNVYQAKYIVGTDYMYDFGKKQHIVRERINDKYSTNTSLGFIVCAPDIYDMENKSKVEEMIPFADEMIRIQLKMQQIIAKAAPSGFAIDIDAITGGLQGMGMGNLKPVDARAIRDQIGDIYYRSVREDGTPITNTRPVQDLPNGLDQSIMVLTQAYNAALERMKETIGLNDAVDGSQPDKKALIGVQKLAVSAHRNALRSLYNAYLRINEEMVRYVANLAQQLIRDGINVDVFQNMVGNATVEQIDLNKLSLADYAISVKMLPDEEERARVEQLLMMGLETGLLNTQDVFAVRRVLREDVDKAEQLLSIREAKRRKEKEQSSMMLQQQNAQVQAQAAQIAEGEKQKTMQMEMQLKSQALQLEYDLRLRNDKEIENEKRKTSALESQYDIEKIQLASKLKGQPSQQGGGYDFEKDSIVRAAGKVEPNIFPQEVK